MTKLPATNMSVKTSKVDKDSFSFLLDFDDLHSRTKSSIPLLLILVNISAQWLIGRFVRASHSKSDLYDCCEQVRSISNLKMFTEPFELCGAVVK
ncbi:TPA: hypothetical protein ACGPA4_002557 [Streptococcus suis]